eukprot:gene33819-53153_t
MSADGAAGGAAPPRGCDAEPPAAAEGEGMTVPAHRKGGE